MATLLIGDVHGCYDELQALLLQAAFDPDRDTLWFTGDLVARGPKSLETLRFVYRLGHAARIVLGNHELHLLAVSSGMVATDSTYQLDEIEQASDRDELLHWLRHQPLIQQHDELKLLMVHAGLSPQWDYLTLQQCALAVSVKLQSDDYQQWLSSLYANDQPDIWSDDLSSLQKLQYSVNVLTRMRFCYRNGRLALHCKHPPESAPKSLVPWFQLPLPCVGEWQVVFGHWSSLMGKGSPSGFYAMDTGCVWGGWLSLLRWEDQRYFYQPKMGISCFL